MRRMIFAAVLALLALHFILLPTSAAEAGMSEIPEDEWQGFVDSIPDDVKDEVAGELDQNSFGDSVVGMTSGRSKEPP